MTKIKSERSKTIINRIGSDGEISVFEVYVNELIYNEKTIWK